MQAAFVLVKYVLEIKHKKDPNKTRGGDVQ